MKTNTPATWLKCDLGGWPRTTLEKEAHQAHGAGIDIGADKAMCIVLFLTENLLISALQEENQSSQMV